VDITRALKNGRLLKAVTGVALLEFETLLTVFEKVVWDSRYQKPRKRAPGGGRKGILASIQHKLFFLLCYLKVYPTYDLASLLWGADRSRVCRWVQNGLPLLEQTLGRALVLPQRRIGSMEEFLKAFPEAKDLFIDGTERRTQRPSKSRNLHRRYSGKKKAHTRKNLIATDAQKRVLLLSPTKNGRRHDKWRVEQTNWLKAIPPSTTVWVDTGFMGIEDQLAAEVPIMRPQKGSKHHPLSSEQKEENRIISGLRVVCEHAIGGIKRFGALVFPYRNRKGQDDTFMSIASGLWNFHLNFT
jgi:hypothetical protein